MQKTSIYDKLTKKYQKELIDNLRPFVKIDSSYDELTASEENPFGKGVSDALNFVTELAKKDGFEVTNYSNKVVEILCGKGDKNITIMAHADVVPAGSNWDHDPFDMVEKKGVLNARGVADDKGPLLASYYALKALRDNNLLGDYQVRFLVGGNEESGSAGIEYYFHSLKKAQPTLGFSPDSDFPIIFAEKGIINFEVKKPVNIPGFISLEGGVAPNAVIERATLTMEMDDKFINFIMDNYHRAEAEIHTVDDITKVVFIGKAAHGATPELGVNAGYMALEALANYSKDKNLIEFVKKFKALDAKGLNANVTSKDMGHNSLNLGLLSTEGNIVSLVLNFRYVEKANPDQMMENIKETLADTLVIELSRAPLLYFAKDSVLISTLVKAYQDETGDLESKPLAIGGGTYAKEADNIVAFGMQFPGWESNMHSPGEAVKKDDLFKAMSIYARAIVELGKKL